MQKLRSCDLEGILSGGLVEKLILKKEGIEIRFLGKFCTDGCWFIAVVKIDSFVFPLLCFVLSFTEASVCFLA